MPTLQDDDLKDLEHQQAIDDGPISPMTDEEKALLMPYQQEMPEFDPSKRLAQNDKKASEDGVSGDKSESSRSAFGEGGNSDTGGINYTPGGKALSSALQGAGVVGGALTLARLAGAFAGRHKKSLAGGGIVASLLIAAGFYGGSLGLVSIKKNAEQRLGGITNTIFEKEFGRMAASERQFVKSAFSSLRVEQNITKLDRALARSGYTLDADGLRVPADARRGLPARTLTDEAEILQEMRFAAKKNLPVNLQGVKTRSRTAKQITKRIGIAQRASIDARLQADEDAKAKAKENARAEAMKGDEPDSDQVRRINEGVGGGEIDEAKQRGDELADELVEDGTRDVAESSEDNLARNLGKNLGEEALEETAQNVGRSISSRLGGIVKGDFTEVIQMTCRISQAGRAAYIAGLINKKVNLMKVFGVLANNADAMVTGQVDTDLLNGIMEAAWVDRETGTPLTDAPGMDGIMNREQRNPSEGEISFFRTDRQDLGGFMGTVIALSSNSVYRSFCDQFNTVGGTIVGSALEVLVPVVAGIITAPAGGSGGGAVIAGQQAAATAVKQSLTRTIGAALIRAITTAAAIEVTTQLAETWMKSYVGSIMSSTMVTFSDSEAGPFMGNAFSAGAGSYYEMLGRGVGMRPLSQLGYIDAMKEVRDHQKTELAEKSLYERFVSVDYRHSDSLASRVLVGSPIATRSIKSMATNLASTYINGGMFKQPQQFMTAAVTTPAYAQDGDVRTDSNGYVVDVWGNYIVGNNYSSVDQQANYETLRATGQIRENGDPAPNSELDNYIKTCTDIDIRKEGTTNEVESVCVSAQAKSYQAYLTFRAAADALDAAYNPQVASGGTGGSSGSTSPTEDTSNTPCPAGTEDGGVHQDYGPGRTPGARIRICGIPGAIPPERGVNSSAAANALAMIEAARAAGITLTGNAFRSYETQQALREQNCPDPLNSPSRDCSPPTAKSGNSMHEVGLAIDFSNYSFSWLSSNAGRYGFRNLPSESWHWSTTGQ